MRFSGLVAVAVAVVAAACAAFPASGSPALSLRAASTNIVVDGSFESPKATPGAWSTYGAGESFGAWHVDSGSIDLVGTYWQAAVGVQSVDLSGDGAGAIYQDLATIPGQTYRVVFSMAGNPDGEIPAIKRMAVLWDGLQVAVRRFDITGHTRSDMGWVTHRLTVTATGTTTRLEFVSLVTEFVGPTLDRVRVYPVLP